MLNNVAFSVSSTPDNLQLQNEKEINTIIVFSIMSDKLGCYALCIWDMVKNIKIGISVN